jgi:hypothetical protein
MIGKTKQCNHFLINISYFYGKDKTAEEKMITIYIFDDVDEHCKEAAVR